MVVFTGMDSLNKVRQPLFIYSLKWRTSGDKRLNNGKILCIMKSVASDCISVSGANALLQYTHNQN